MEIQQGGSTGGGAALTVTDTITTVTNTSEITFVGATVSNGGGGNAIVTITSGNIGGSIARNQVAFGSTVSDEIAGSSNFIYGLTAAAFQVGFATTNYLEVLGSVTGPAHRLGS